MHAVSRRWRSRVLAVVMSSSLLSACGRDSEGDVASVRSVGPMADVPAPAARSAKTAAAGGIVELPLYVDGVDDGALPLSLAVETIGGASTVLIARGSRLPVERTEVFSTAVDNQASVEIHLVQGEAALVAQNRTVARLQLTSIPPAPRGVPQIEIRLVIDARGRLTVRARDLADGSIRPVVVQGQPGAPLRPDEVSSLQSSRPAPPDDPGVEPVSVKVFGDDVAVERLPLPVGIETLRGENTVVIARGTALPTRFEEVFSTAADNQASVEVHLVLGGRALAADNLTLGVFQLGGIPPAPRGVPQIAVRLEIDAAGVLSATAVDRGTGESRGITVTGGLAGVVSTADVQRIQAVTEAAATEDAEVRERIAALNRLETLVVGGRALMAQLPSRAQPETIAACRAALGAAEARLGDAPKTADLDAVNKAYDALEAASHQASRELYAAAGAASR